MKNRIRAIIVIVILIAWYLMYHDNQNMQQAIDALDKTAENTVIQHNIPTTTVETWVVEIMSGDESLSGTQAPDFVDGAIEASIDVAAQTTSAE